MSLHLLVLCPAADAPDANAAVAAACAALGLPAPAPGEELFRRPLSPDDAGSLAGTAAPTHLCGVVEDAGLYALAQRAACGPAARACGRMCLALDTDQDKPDAVLASLPTPLYPVR